MSAPHAADPTADMLSDLGANLDPTWFLLALLMPAAIVVLWYGNREFRRWRGSSQIEPRGRPTVDWHPEPDAKWEGQRRRLEARPPTPIASAPADVVRFVGTIVRASGNLGGAAGRECVWRNRLGGHPQSAVAADVIVLADDSGRCGVERLEAARVIAPTEKHSIHHESVGLYIGDTIEVMGRFFPERVGEDDDPAQLVYGTLGTRGPLHVRVVERPGRATEIVNESSPSTTDSLSASD